MMNKQKHAAAMAVAELHMAVGNIAMNCGNLGGTGAGYAVEMLGTIGAMLSRQYCYFDGVYVSPNIGGWFTLPNGQSTIEEGPLVAVKRAREGKK